MDKGFTLSPTQGVSLLSTHTLLSTSTLLSTHTVPYFQLATHVHSLFISPLTYQSSQWILKTPRNLIIYAYMRALFETVGQEVGKFEAVDVRLGATNAQLGERIEGVRVQLGQVGGRLEQAEARIEGVEPRFEARFEGLEQLLRQVLEAQQSVQRTIWTL